MAAYTKKDNNPTIGMDDAQAQHDRYTWGTTVPLITGGVNQDWDLGNGPMVGNSYDLDPLGEERSLITHTGDTEKRASGMIGGGQGQAGSGKPQT